MSDSYLENPDSWRLFTPLKGVPYRFVDAEAEYTYKEGEAIWSFIIPQDRISDFKDEFFPPPDPGKVDMGFVELPRPKVMPGDPTMVATSMKIMAHIDDMPFDLFSHDGNAPLNTYQRTARVDVTFSTKEDIEYLDIRADGSGEFLTIPPSEKAVSYDVVEGGPTLEEIKANPEIYPEYIKRPKSAMAATVMLPLVNWSVTWKDVPYKFFKDTMINRIRRCIGKVNHAALDFLFDAAPETILFMNWDYSQTNTWRLYEGVREKAVTITLNFAEKRIPLDESDENGDPAYGGHNHHYMPGRGWVYVRFGEDTEDGNTERTSYLTADLSVLIRKTPEPETPPAPEA